MIMETLPSYLQEECLSKRPLKYHYSRSLYVEVHLSLNLVQYDFTKTNLTAKNVWAQHYYNLVMCGQNVSMSLADYLLDTSSKYLIVGRREKIYIFNSPPRQSNKSTSSQISSLHMLKPNSEIFQVHETIA